jgi:KaiC/GvpD/RAD55 family RecA-like ATPase
MRRCGKSQFVLDLTIEMARRGERVTFFTTPQNELNVRRRIREKLGHARKRVKVRSV